MSKAIASSVRDFAFDTLLMNAIKTEKEHDGEGTEDDPADGTSFEAVQYPAASSSGLAHATTSRKPDLSPSAPISPPLSTNTLPTDTSRDLNDSFESELSSDADTSTPATQKCKRKSKSKIAYKKLAFKRRRAADRQNAKDDADVNVRPSMRARHTTTTPVDVPTFSLDTKTPAKTGYVGIRDPNASKRVYTLSEMVGEGSRFNFNLVEWDGKYVCAIFASLSTLTRSRVSCPITDKKGRVIATLCGHPDDPNWDSAHTEVANIMRRAQRRIRRTKKNSRHRRGHFTALAAGVSFGGGQRVSDSAPCTLYLLLT
jgi:hypothetical protein